MEWLIRRIYDNTRLSLKFLKAFSEHPLREGLFCFYPIRHCRIS